MDEAAFFFSERGGGGTGKSEGRACGVEPSCVERRERGRGT